MINYTGAVVKPNSKAEEKEKEKESKSGVSGLLPSPLDPPLEKKESVKKICGGCKTVCSLACFACSKVWNFTCSNFLFGISIFSLYLCLIINKSVWHLIVVAKPPKMN